MVETKGNWSRTSLVRELRRALRSLYDPDALRKNPLMELLPVDEEDGPSSLQRMLVAAIEALKPDVSVSPQSNAWRTYHTLSSRYVQQFPQGEVAKGLGLSLRQMRRQDNLALRTLAEYLWTHYDLQRKVEEQLSTPFPAGDELHPLDTETPSREEELEWLEKSLASEPVAVEEVIQVLLKTVEPLAQALNVRLEWTVPENLPHLIVQLTPMRQAFLTVLTAAIRCVPGGQINIMAEAHAQQVWIGIQPILQQPAISSLAADQVENIEMARQLVGLSGGSLEMVPGEGGYYPLTVRLILPARQQAAVLVIDDNVDTLQLFQRYLAGSRYAFIGTHDPDQALTLAEKLAPRIIVLDVMLPGVDGWELLGRLREHPKIYGVPIIVCTILPQEQLALALRAAAFIRKPVSQTALLSALDHQFARLSRESG